MLTFLREKKVTKLFFCSWKNALWYFQQRLHAAGGSQHITRLEYFGMSPERKSRKGPLIFLWGRGGGVGVGMVRFEGQFL